MNISAINDLLSSSSINTKNKVNNALTNSDDDNTVSFNSLFKSALNMVNDTNNLTNSAEEEEINYALGKSDSPLELMVAQSKANTSLSYTVAVRNAVLDAYKEIMNIQF